MSAPIQPYERMRAPSRPACPDSRGAGRVRWRKPLWRVSNRGCGDGRDRPRAGSGCRKCPPDEPPSLQFGTLKCSALRPLRPADTAAWPYQTEGYRALNQGARSAAADDACAYQSEGRPGGRRGASVQAQRPIESAAERTRASVGPEGRTERPGRRPLSGGGCIRRRVPERVSARRAVRSAKK